MHPHDILDLYALRGHLAYDGEGVTQLQHGWQCAGLAHQAAATPALQLAAWLHDLGHLLAKLDGTPTTSGINDGHEHLGAQALAATFGPAVAEPVTLHVQAKRWMVATQPGYADRLSPDSVRSLALQGGAMEQWESAAFLQRPRARDALRLRVWDDHAKRASLHPPSQQQALGELEDLMAHVRQAHQAKPAN